MNRNIIDTNNYNMATVELEHGTETLKAVEKISEFISTLNISPDSNNKLVSMMMEQLTTTGREQFLKGFETGVKIVGNAKKR